MSHWPNPEILRQFLDETLQDPVRQQVMDHLESCSACQEILHELVFESDEDGPSPRDQRGEGFDRASAREILNSLAKKVPPRLVLPNDNDWNLAVEFPSPATEHGPLGRLGVYHIQEEVGSGTYGVVFKAYEEKLDRFVALKVLRPHLAALPESRRRFEREARAAAKVKNPHVVVIHSVYDDAPNFPLPYIAMEFVEGKSLQTFLSEHLQGLSTAEAVRLVQQVARGLAAAHSHGVFHRDVKPENILLQEDEKGWSAIITDFGIAQVIEETRSRSPLGSVIGTPPYMSPEAFVSPETVDGRSDIYSLGVTFYQLLTGHLPFAGRDVRQVQRQVMEPRFEPPRRWNPNLRHDLEAVVLKCMAKEPCLRYETAAELVHELGRWLDNEPVGAWRYTSAELFRLWFKRNRWLAAFLATIGFLVIVLALWQRSFSFLRAEREQARQEEERAREKVVNDYWNTAEGQRKLGRFGEAAFTLEKSLSVLNRSPALTGDRQRFESRMALLRRLDDFTRNSDHAWFFAGEERGVETRDACENALRCYGVLDRPGWQTVSPAVDLPDDETALVRSEVHRLLVLLAAMRIQSAIISYVHLQFKEVDYNLHRALTALELAVDLEKLGLVAPSKTAARLEKGARRLMDASRLSGLLANQPNTSRGEANTSLFENLTAEDGFFLGVMHVYFAKHLNDSFAGVIRRFSPGEFDFENPRDTAVEMLRHAVQVEPRQYWSSFMLGRILAFRSPDGRADLNEALQVFNICVSVRPDYSRGYEQRALTLVQLSLEATRAQHAEMLRHDAGADLAKALDLAPDDPSTHWVRGQAFVLLGDAPKALASFTRALELEDHLQEKISRRNQLEGPRALVKRVLDTKPGDPAATRLFELIERAGKE